MAGLPGSSRGINRTEAMGCSIWSLSASMVKVQGFHTCLIERRWPKSHKMNTRLNFLYFLFLQHPPTTQYEWHHALSESRDIYIQPLHHTTQNLLCTTQPEKSPASTTTPELHFLQPIKRQVSVLATLNRFKGILHV